MKAAFWITFTVTAAITLLVARFSDRLVSSVVPMASPLPSRVGSVPDESRVKLLVEPSSVVRVGASSSRPTGAAKKERNTTAPPEPASNMEREFLTSVLLPSSGSAQKYEPQQLLPHAPLRPNTRVVNTIDTRKELAEVFSSRRSREAQSVIAALNQYARAWNEKDAADIHAIRPGLERRTVKEELAGARSILMRIHPVSAPRIEGNTATVECLHRVDQVFDDGTEKQNPGVRMTYVLVKRGGNWLIADSR